MVIQEHIEGSAVTPPVYCYSVRAAGAARQPRDGLIISDVTIHSIAFWSLQLENCNAGFGHSKQASSHEFAHRTASLYDGWGLSYSHGYLFTQADEQIVGFHHN